MTTQQKNTDETICHAAAGGLQIAGGVLPTNLQWMPPGKHDVQPMGFDAPFEINVTPAIAALADSQLQQMIAAHAAGQDVEPYIDINHEDKVRAFLPTKISWGGNDPKSGGIRVHGKWTGGGASAALNGEQCVISPSWALHRVTKAFLGIKRNLGGLVPRSAFNSIQAFAKADVGAGALGEYQFSIQAKAYAATHQIADEFEAQAKYASTPAGRESYRSYTDSMRADKRALAKPDTGAAVATCGHEFVTQAKAFGEAHQIGDVCEAQAKFAATAAGRLLYNSYVSSISRGK